MISPGLLSVTFRKLLPLEIVRLVRDAGLQVIEWGGDVHVPPGDPANAREVRRMTEEAGLAVASYGSYYRVSADGGPPFAAVLETAAALGAPEIRVWAGNRGTFESDDGHFETVVAESLRLADQAQNAGIVMAFEFHGGTINDTYAASRRLLAAAAHPAIRTYWQPPIQIPENESLAGLRSILPHVRDVHVFHWTTGENSGLVRHPLSRGAAFWSRVLQILRSTGRPHAAMLEFVRNDSPDAFIGDARTLLALLREDDGAPPA
jgi:sugar phosphate isomerase/epimerase